MRTLIIAGLAAMLGSMAFPARGENLTGLEYVSEEEVTPEGNNVTYQPVSGRSHTNGYFLFHPGAQPWGLTTQRMGPWESPLPDPPAESFRASNDYLDMNQSDLLDRIEAACSEGHHYSGSVDTMALTTLIKFAGSSYHVAQYLPELSGGPDTVYVQIEGQNWITRNLPMAPQEAPVIWIEGVGRIKGIIEGRVTVLCSDSLFIMGDLITADTDITHCGNPDLFGMVPEGSPNRIGLIGEKDIILAATFENGFSNGQNNGPTCGVPFTPNEAVVQSCMEGRKDIILTAAVLALGCTLEAEFWKTTAWNALPQSISSQYFLCGLWNGGGLNNTEVTVWDTIPGGERPDCPDADAEFDLRGTFWFCGSLCHLVRGFLVRNAPGPWGNVTIGYMGRVWREDPNLAFDPPPYWPDVRWLPPAWLDVSTVVGSSSACGDITNVSTFLDDWDAGLVGLQFDTHQESCEDSLAIRIVLSRGGVDLIIEETRHPIVATGLDWRPGVDLAPWLDQPATLWLEVWRADVLWRFPDQYVAAAFDRPVWNTDGAACSWQLDALPVAPAATPAAFALSQPWPNPFNPVTHVELSLPAAGEVRLEVFDLAGRREALVHDGPLPAGAHAFTLDGSAWPAGLHLLTLRHGGRVETRKVLLLK